jgi:excisionase family DNA binding protein
MSEKVYTTFEVSRFCRVDISTVMGWVDDGKLKAYRTPGGHRRISHSDLLTFLKKYQMPIHPVLRKMSNRVLIVDDDPATVRVLRRLVERIAPESEIEVARDGFEAGRQLEIFFPDLILLDLMLPGIDGFQVCANIRADEGKKHIRILAISALRTEGIEKKVLASGADLFIQKPFEIDRVRQAIARLIDVEGDQRTIEKIDRRAVDAFRMAEKKA